MTDRERLAVRLTRFRRWVLVFGVLSQVAVGFLGGAVWLAMFFIAFMVGMNVCAEEC